MKKPNRIIKKVISAMLGMSFMIVVATGCSGGSNTDQNMQEEDMQEEPMEETMPPDTTSQMQDTTQMNPN